MGALLSEQLGLPQLTLARKVTVDPDAQEDHHRAPDRQTATRPSRRSMPVVVGVVEKINEPRYPSFKGIMAAKKKPLTTLSVA